MAEELLRAEGFTDVEYPRMTAGDLYAALAAGTADLSLGFIAPAIVHIEAGVPIVCLAGVHPGCYKKRELKT